MSEIIYAPQVVDSKDKESMNDIFKSFGEYYPNYESYTTEIKDISLSSNCVPNWSCAWNRIEHMGMRCTPIAQKGQFTLVAMENGKNEFYRNEDLDQIIKPKHNGTTQTVSHTIK